MARKKLGALLEEKGYINEFQLVAALSHQRKWKTKIGQSLIELGFLEEKQLYEVLAEQLGLEFVNLSKVGLAPEVLRIITRDKIKQLMALPIKKEGNTWTVAVCDPEAPGLMNNLKSWLGGEIKLVLATTLDLETKTRKVPDKVPVASVQPVKKAFIKNHNGELSPFEEPSLTPPPEEPGTFLSDPPPAEDEGPVELGLPMENMMSLPPENGEVVEEVDLETLEISEGPVPEDELSLDDSELTSPSFNALEEAPPSEPPVVAAPPLEEEEMLLPLIEAEPIPMDEAALPEGELGELPSLDDLPPIPREEAPLSSEDELLPPGEDEVPIEAPHESAAGISVEGPDLEEPEPLPSAEESIPLESADESALAGPGTVDLDELLPPSIDQAESGSEAGPSPEEFPPPIEAPPLEELEPPEFSESSEPSEPELSPTVDSEEILSADDVWQGTSPAAEELLEAPPLDLPPGLDEVPGLASEEVEPPGEEPVPEGEAGKEELWSTAAPEPPGSEAAAEKEPFLEETEAPAEGPDLEVPSMEPPSLDDLSLEPPSLDELLPLADEPAPAASPPELEPEGEDQPAGLVSMDEVFQTPEPPLDQEPREESEPDTAPAPAEESPEAAAPEDLDPEFILDRIGELQKQIQGAVEEIGRFKQALETKQKSRKK